MAKDGRPRSVPGGLMGTAGPADDALSYRAIREAAWDEGLRAYLDYANARRGARLPYPENPYRKADQ